MARLMAKTLRTVAVIAGAVGLAATGIGVFAAAGAATSLGIASAGTVASIATVVAGTASLGASALQKKPPARGSLSQILIAIDPPQPYMIGETYFAGVLRHDTAYGGEVADVKNPYRGMVIVYSGSGPVEQLVSTQVDFETDLSYYSGFLFTDSQLGATPEATALTPNWPGMPGWDADHKLSGQAVILWNLKFDKKGKRFASGVPVIGGLWKGVKVYDPREDSSYPGGSGTQRIADEATWAYSDNPALHALSYAYGRYQNGQQVFGVGLPSTALDLPAFVTLANVCEANGWRCSGVIYEPDDRWKNIKDILAAGGAEPVFAGGTLSLRIRTPLVPLDTITEADLADEDASVTAMQSYRDRLNTIVPKYRSAEHNWELVSADKVQVESYLTEDGEEKIEEIPWNMVRDVDQAAQLAAYRLVDGRELGPITLTCLPRLRAYRPGECLQLDLPSLGLDTPAIILTRKIDPATMKVTLTLVGESPTKHDYALGLTGTAPPTPALGQTPQDRDETAGFTVLPKATGLTATTGAGAGEANLTWQNPEQVGWTYVKIFHHTANVFGSATPEVAELVGGLKESKNVTVTGLSAGTQYFWIVAYDEDDNPFDPSTPDSATVT